MKDNVKDVYALQTASHIETGSNGTKQFELLILKDDVYLSDIFMHGKYYNTLNEKRRDS